MPDIYRDPLSVRALRAPVLNEYMGSPQQRLAVLQVAEEIRRQYVMRAPKETGRLAASAKVTGRRSAAHADRRWFADMDVLAPYADEVEARDHILASVLRDMGFRSFEVDALSGPTGRVPREQSAPAFVRQERSREEVRQDYTQPLEATTLRGRRDDQMDQLSDTLSRARLSSRAGQDKAAAVEAYLAEHRAEISDASAFTARNILSVYRMRRDAKE